MTQRSAIVFGGSGGLGAGCVRALAREWDFVAITYRGGRERAEKLAAELPEGCSGFPVQCDTTSAESVNAAVDAVIAA